MCIGFELAAIAASLKASLKVGCTRGINDWENLDGSEDGRT